MRVDLESLDAPGQPCSLLRINRSRKRRDATRPVNREKKNLCHGETLRKGKSRLDENKGEKEQSSGREKV